MKKFDGVKKKKNIKTSSTCSHSQIDIFIDNNEDTKCIPPNDFSTLQRVEGNRVPVRRIIHTISSQVIRKFFLNLTRRARGRTVKSWKPSLNTLGSCKRKTKRRRLLRGPCSSVRRERGVGRPRRPRKATTSSRRTDAGRSPGRARAAHE